MTPGRLQSWINVACVGSCLVIGSASLAQPVGTPGTTTPPPLTNAASPTFPTGKCPVDTFRELLAMSASERNQFLTNRSLVSQRMIQAKIKEYLALNPEMRELRLRATELRWYLVPLMNAPATNRTTQLAAIPEQVRPFVEDRLRLWDTLTPADQKRLLSPAVDTFATQAARSHDSSNQTAVTHAIISPARRQWLEKGIQHWQEMSEDQRQEIASQFFRFFELTPQEKSKTINTLSDQERRQLERTLASFDSLSADKRAQCLESFDKFASLSVEERQQFLVNAQRWESLTPTERQAWRDLVNAQLTPRRPVRIHLNIRRPAVTAGVTTNQN
jgi:hypothetical protein